jgi:hypothetical protein
MVSVITLDEARSAAMIHVALLHGLALAEDVDGRTHTGSTLTV